MGDPQIDRPVVGVDPGHLATNRNDPAVPVPELSRSEGHAALVRLRTHSRQGQRGETDIGHVQADELDVPTAEQPAREPVRRQHSAFGIGDEDGCGRGLHGGGEGRLAQVTRDRRHTSRDSGQRPNLRRVTRSRELEPGSARRGHLTGDGPVPLAERPRPRGGIRRVCRPGSGGHSPSRLPAHLPASRAPSPSMPCSAVRKRAKAGGGDANDGAVRPATDHRELQETDSEQRDRCGVHARRRPAGT